MTGSRNIAVVIPARMGSSRFPGKPLVPILGMPMIEHVYRRANMASLPSEVFVATCDQEISGAVDDFGGRYIWTSSEHRRASDRVAEAAAHIDAEIIVMVQGDEPMVVPRTIDRAVKGLKESREAACVNLAKEIENEEEFKDPNVVKLTMDREGHALYFSRQPIPSLYDKGWQESEAWKQVCVIPFRRRSLLRYARLEPTPLEKAESVDMLRFLEHGMEVKLIETQEKTRAVDTPEDRELVEEMMTEDRVVSDYLDVT